MRRSPVQDRSRRKVALILDHAEALLAEIGYESLVASPMPLLERTGVTRGVFYSYFESPADVVDALAERLIEENLRVADTLAEQEYATPEAVFDAFHTMYSLLYTNPIAYELWCRGRVSPEVDELDARANVAIADSLRTVLDRQFGWRITTLHATVATELYDRIVRLAHRDDPRGDPAVRQEARRALGVYLTECARTTADG